MAGGQTCSVTYDTAGTVIYDSRSGTKVWEASYLPFGGVHTSTGTPSDIRFPGQWFQSEAGLHQNWMRDYDPTIGRYVQGDPLGFYCPPIHSATALPAMAWPVAFQCVSPHNHGDVPVAAASCKAAVRSR